MHLGKDVLLGVFFLLLAMLLCCLSVHLRDVCCIYKHSVLLKMAAVYYVFDRYHTVVTLAF